MKPILALLLTFAVTVSADEPRLKPEARKRVEKNLQVLAENIDRARKNVAAATHNIDVLTAEIAALEKLQKEHEGLRNKYQNIDKNGADPEKTKALLKSIQDSHGQLEAQRAPLERQLKAWKERLTAYDSKLGEFEKKREELEAPPSSGSDNTEN